MNAHSTSEGSEAYIALGANLGSASIPCMKPLRRWTNIRVYGCCGAPACTKQSLLGIWINLLFEHDGSRIYNTCSRGASGIYAGGGESSGESKTYS